MYAVFDRFTGQKLSDSYETEPEVWDCANKMRVIQQAWNTSTEETTYLLHQNYEIKEITDES